MSDQLEPELFLPSDRFARTHKPTKIAWDDDAVDPEASTYLFSIHGPEPAPHWVITEDAARQHELGMLKSGKEADVYLVERTLDERVNILAAKRYRSLDERLFRNDARYRQSRRTGIRRVDLAMAQGTRAGMAFRAELWVQTEFDTLCQLWEAGVSVPYPVQRLGHEVMIEFVGDESGAAPRLVAAKPSAEQARELFSQLVDNLSRMAALGVVHGDLSPYNLLVWEDRLVLIDFPQAVDPILNPDGLALLERDVTNCCTWFAKRGVAEADPAAVLSELAAQVFSR